MATPITRAEVLNLIQSKPSTNGAGLAKKGVCHKCNKPGHWSRECPENNKSKGRNGNERPKDVKSWKSTPPPPGAPQVKQTNGKAFNWCASCKRWTTTHTTATHTGGSKRGADEANGGGTAINNVSLAFDPSVWTTENDVIPSVTDALYVLRTMVTRKFPALFVLLTYVSAIFSVPFAKTMWNSSVPFAKTMWTLTREKLQSTMTHFIAVDWTQVMEVAQTHCSLIWSHVLQFFYAHQEALIAPLLWFLLATVVLCWLPNFTSTPPEPDPKEKPTRRQLRALKRHYRKGTRRTNASQVGSIRSHGLHRKYPINLRSMGHYIRRNAPTLVERQQQLQLNNLHSKVASLLKRVDSLKRPIAYSAKPWTCRHRKDTIVHGPTQPFPTFRGTSHSPSESLKEGTKISRCDVSDAYYDAPPRRRARGHPKSSGVYRPVSPSGFQEGLGNHHWTSKQLQAARKMAMHVNMAKIPGGNYSTILRMALQSTERFRESLPKTATFPVIWDSGASISITPDCKDFVGPINTPGPITQLQGIAKGLRIEGQGHVLWAMQDTLGNLRMIKVPAYLVSRIKVRLLSTTSLLQAYPGETITIEAHQLTLSGTADKARGQLIARVNPDNNLPTSDAHRSSDTPKAVAALNITLNTVHESNLNLTEAEKELLRWHHRLGHLSFRKIQFIMRTGVLSRSESHRSLHTAACRIVNPPKCAACQYGKQHQRPAPAKISTAIKDRAGVLKADNLLPGQQVSIDHFICGTKGRLFSSAGRSLNSDMFAGGCLFIDHASNFVHVEFQKHLNTHETLKAKQNFELMARDSGVIPQSYLSDNGGSFTSAKFTEHLGTLKQVVKFAGVGAHHHNGHAERAIQTIMSIARTMMLHSAVHWPDVADATLWPMAVSHAIFLHNHVPDLSTGLCPSDVFTKSRWEQRKYHDLHVWGCPVYALEKTIVDGKKLPRWKPRSIRCVNMGLSKKHASTVPLVLNPETGYITPQYHIVFDDWFATVATNVDALPDFNTTRWARLFGDSKYQFPFDEDDNDDATEEARMDSQATEAVNENQTRVAAAMDESSAIEQLPVPPLAETPPMTPAVQQPLPSSPLLTPRPPTPMMSQTREMPIDHRSLQSPPTPDISNPSLQLRPHSSSQAKDGTPHKVPATPISPVHQPVFSPVREQPPMSETRENPVPDNSFEQPATSPTPPMSPPPPTSPRRSVRIRTAPQRLGSFASPSAWIFEENGIILSPTAFKAAASDPDTLSFDQAMSDIEHVTKWMEAAAKEVASLEKNGTWKEVSILEAKTKILPGTWVFRRKRSPDGEITKYKARYCVRGDLEEGEPETYAPVVAWSSVRLFLVLSLTLGWQTCSIDFSSAFVQANLTDPVWIHMPRGFKSDQPSDQRTCLRLVKSLYGLSVAPRLWYQHIREALLLQGLKQSATDSCLLYSKTIMIVLYVDDLGIAYSNKKDLDKLFQDLTELGLEFTREGTFTDFLGIKFVKDEVTNTVTLTQKGLIQKIIKATGLQDCNSNHTPALQACLGIDPDGEPMDEFWNYRSIVGMLLYLSTNTRPDITFAVSQVARFNHSPKKSHASAIKTIVRYLHRTADKGTIVTPTGDLSLDCYVDADFAGLHGRDPDHSDTSAKSRTGYIITLGGCPILWKSQLQTEISLSTLESEYSALSASMRTLLPLRDLLSEICRELTLPPDFKSTIRCRVFEDNNGALLLATKQRITNRTKYFLVKWHFFWHHVRNGDVEVLKIATTDQLADYLTKGLNREVFERIRKLAQGW
jgi:hypothetical protein